MACLWHIDFFVFFSIVVLVWFKIVATWTISLGGVGVTFSIFCFNRYYTLKERTEVRAEEAYKKWETKAENKKYILLKQQLAFKQERLEEITINLKQVSR